MNREAFEAWFISEMPMESLITDQDNNYKYQPAIASWEAWQAALASQAQQEIKPYAYSVENCFGEKVMYIKEDDAIRYAKAANIQEDQIFALYAKPLPPAPEGDKPCKQK